MSTYVIGDVHGCFDPLRRLLDKIQFNEHQDTLWFTGDLVNRGPHSLETIRWIKNLPKQTIIVLGNHDLTLLAVGREAIPYNPKRHTFIDILKAPDRDELLNWLQAQPLLHHDNHSGFMLIHAGLPPQWDLDTAKMLAREVEHVLQSSDNLEFFKHMYGNFPKRWEPHLIGWDRLRFIVNCLTRLRFCNEMGELELTVTGFENNLPHNLYPWFKISHRKSAHLNILFGHWAALEGQADVPNVFPLDTGCVWGNALTAFRLEDRQKITVPCSDLK